MYAESINSHAETLCFFFRKNLEQMARHTRRRYYKRRTARWSPNLDQIVDSFAVTNTGQFGYPTTLAVNPTATTSTTISQIFTVKNVEASFVFEANELANTLEALAFYIMYIPEGFNYQISNLPQLHPEWIMNYKFIGSPTYEQPVEGQQPAPSQQYQPVKIKTRMARKLNSGDRIILFAQGYRQGTTTTSINITMTGLVRWWTKAN